MSAERAAPALRESSVEVAPQRPELSGPDRLLLLAALAGPLAWACQLVIALPVVPWMCHRGLRWPLHAVTGVVLLVIVVAIAHCRARFAGEREKLGPLASTPPAGDAHAPVDASPVARRGIAWAGVALGIFFLLLALATDFPGLILEPCR